MFRHADDHSSICAECGHLEVSIKSALSMYMPQMHCVNASRWATQL
jgi:hypothetical protein